MSVIYLVSDGGKLVKKGDVLQLKQGEDVLNTIFLHRTEQVVIVGRTEISTGALNALMHRRIETVFLGKNGRFNGRIDFQTGKNILLRKKQYQLLEDDPFRLRFAKHVVMGKMRNQLAFAQRLGRKSWTPPRLQKPIQGLKDIMDKVDACDNLESLRGLEGMGAKHFFNAYRHAFQPEWADFPGRSMNPPKTNVNAVLSFLYTLILFRVNGAIEAEGLDPYAGYFHRCDYGKMSLVYDLMEEYRTPLADTLCSALFNLGVLVEGDFRRVKFSEVDDEYPLSPGEEIQSEQAFAVEKEGILMTPEGIRKVLPQFERKLDDEIVHPVALQKVSYRHLFRKQAKQFRRFLVGEASEYIPLMIK